MTHSLRPIPGRARGERLQLVEPKTTQSRRTLHLPGFVAAELGRLPRTAEFVFATSRGTPLDPRNTLKHFKKDLAAAGLGDLRIHDLRHTAATLLLQGGVDLQTLRETLGHSNIATTAMYAHVTSGLRQRAADTMDNQVAARLLSIEAKQRLAEHELAS